MLDDDLSRPMANGSLNSGGASSGPVASSSGASGSSRAQSGARGDSLDDDASMSLRLTLTDADGKVGAPLLESPLPKVLSKADKGRFALITLSLINLLNYIDRYVPSATKQYIQDDLGLTDAQTSIPLTAFVLVYMCCSPLFSMLSDRGWKRKYIIASGVMLWSAATAAGALAINFWTLLVSRALVGVGEAAYATIAPSLLSDFYPASQRNFVLSLFYLAIPLGSAMGFAIGGEIGGAFGWRYAFLVAGAPGILVAGMCLMIDEPRIGAQDRPQQAASDSSRPISPVGSAKDMMFGLNEDGMASDNEDGEEEEELAIPADAFAVQSELGGPALSHPLGHSHDPEHLAAPHAHAHGGQNGVRSRSDSAAELCDMKHTVPPPWKESIGMLLRNPTYMYSTLGLTCVIFASGGLADWFPSWLSRVHDMEKNTAATVVGAITCVGGIVGTTYGSWLGEKAKGRIAQPYLGVSGLNLVVTSVCCWLIMIAPNVYLIGVLVFVAQVCMWAYSGPITALTLNCVQPNLRVRAFSFQIFLTHALGDAISPTIVGVLSDALDSIRTALLIIPVAFSLGMLIWVVGWRRLAGSEEFHGGPSQAGGRSRRASLAHKHAEQQLRVSTDESLRDPLLAMEDSSAISPPIHMARLNTKLQKGQEGM